MPNVTAICYLSSLLFYGLGYSKTLVIQNAVTLNTTYDYTIHVLATGYFVLAILLAVIGSLFFYVKNNKEQEVIDMKDIECRDKGDRKSKSDDRRRASIIGVRAQLTQYDYRLDLDRKMSS